MGVFENFEFTNTFSLIDVVLKFGIIEVGGFGPKKRSMVDDRRSFKRVSQEKELFEQRQKKKRS